MFDERQVAPPWPRDDFLVTILSELAEALRELHRRLVERMRRDDERERQAVFSAAEFLQRLTSDARFAWLHTLSELIVDLDVFLRPSHPRPRTRLLRCVRRSSD